MVARRSGREAAKAEFSSENSSDEKGREAKEWDDPASLGQFVHNLGDLLAKKFGTPGCWMANAVRIKTKLLKLRSGDFSQRNDLLARK